MRIFFLLEDFVGRPSRLEYSMRASVRYRVYGLSANAGMSTPRGPNMEKLPDDQRGLAGPSTAAGLIRANVNHSIQYGKAHS